MSTDRKTLRRMVLRKVGDFLLATATSGGSTTTFIDATRFYGQPGTYAGRQAYVSGGTAANLGQIRYIQSYNATTHAITFQSALPSATASGDEIEITNTYGMGMTHEMANDAINYALAIAQRHARVPAVSDIATAFDGESARTFDIPSGWVGVESVHYQNSTTEAWLDVKRAAKLNQNGWAVDAAQREVTITGEWARRVNDKMIRLYGYTLPSALTDDDDTTDVDVEWVVLTAAAHMLLDVVRSRAGADWQGQGLYYSDQAARLIPRLSPNFKPSYQAIPPGGS